MTRDGAGASPRPAPRPRLPGDRAAWTWHRSPRWDGGRSEAAREPIAAGRRPGRLVGSRPPRSSSPSSSRARPRGPRRSRSWRSRPARGRGGRAFAAATVAELALGIGVRPSSWVSRSPRRRLRVELAGGALSASTCSPADAGPPGRRDLPRAPPCPRPGQPSAPARRQLPSGVSTLTGTISSGAGRRSGCSAGWRRPATIEATTPATTATRRTGARAHSSRDLRGGWDGRDVGPGLRCDGRRMELGQEAGRDTGTPGDPVAPAVAEADQQAGRDMRGMNRPLSVGQHPWSQARTNTTSSASAASARCGGKAPGGRADNPVASIAYQPQGASATAELR
jgi:hypothetical protein